MLASYLFGKTQRAEDRGFDIESDRRLGVAVVEEENTVMVLAESGALGEGNVKRECVKLSQLEPFEHFSSEDLSEPGELCDWFHIITTSTA